MLTPDTQTTLRLLRERAEQRRIATASLSADVPADARRLVQELQVHQIELEMQYEELLLAQSEIAASRARYHDLYELAPVGYCTLALDGTLLQLNQRLAQLLGQPRPQLTGRRLALFVHPTERERFGRFLDQVWADPTQQHSIELAMARPDDSWVYALLEATAEPGHLPAEPTGRLVFTDVTARRRALAELAASEARFRATFEQSSDGMALVENHRFVDVNAAVLRLLGRQERSEVVGHQIAEFWPEHQPDGRRSLDVLTQCLRRAATHGWCRLEWQRLGAQGEVVWDELSFNPVVIHGRPLLHAAWRDITERKLTEQHLAQSEQYVQHALAATSTGAWSYHLTTHLLTQDDRAQAIFSLPAAEVPSGELLARIHPDDRAGVVATITQTRDAHAPFELECRLVLPGGGTRYVAVSGQFSYHPATQAPECLSGLVRDITRRREGQQQLDYKSRLLDNILRQLPVLLGRVGPDHRFRQLAGRGLRPLGLADDEVVGELDTERFPQEARRIDALLAGGSESYVVSFPASEGEGRVYYQTYTYFDEEQQEGVFFSLDITESERLKAEAERLRQQQQQQVLAAVLTAQEEERRRIAESLHNGLGQLLYGTRLHLDLLPASDKVAPIKALLSEAIATTRNLSFELTPGVLEEFGLAVALRELAKRIPASKLRIDLNLSGLTEALPATLQTAAYRMVQELLNNVIKHAQAQEVFVEVSREDDTLYISVEDDGVGFDTTQLEVSHKGIGMVGLRARAGLLNGILTVQSRLGQGTRVFLVLPVSND